MNPNTRFWRSSRTHIEAFLLSSTERLACNCTAFWSATTSGTSVAARADVPLTITNLIRPGNHYQLSNFDPVYSGGPVIKRSAAACAKSCRKQHSGRSPAITVGSLLLLDQRRLTLPWPSEAKCITHFSGTTQLTAKAGPGSGCQLPLNPWWGHSWVISACRYQHAHSKKAQEQQQQSLDVAAEQADGTQGTGTQHRRISGGGYEGGTEDKAGQLLPLRAALRLLYKRVHPDVFHDQPLAKAENERSFKLLQEYVQLARGGDPRSPAARLPYYFAFYLRDAPQRVAAGESESPAIPATPPLTPPVGGRLGEQQQQGSASAAARDNGDSSNSSSSGSAGELSGLHFVQVTLPPPAISAPDAKELAAPTRKALVKLLAACGLASTGRDGGERPANGDGAGAAAEGGALSLAAFLPEAVEALRQAEAARPSDPAVRVANLRGAMRLHHKVMVSFSDKHMPAGTQATLLERLARVVDTAGPELRLQGCHIVLGDRLGLDRLGHLCLSAAEPDDTWVAFLAGVDMDFVLQLRKNVQMVRSLEAKVAQAIGVAQVFTPYGNLTEPSYREFLERLAAAAVAKGPLGGGAFRNVSLCGLAPLPSEPSQPRASVACRPDETIPGVIQVSTDAATEEIYAGVARLGPQVQVAARVQRQIELQLQELSDKTRQRLRMRSLTRDPRIAPDHFRRACGLLLEHAAALMPLLEGCTVCIGFSNRLAPDGSCIEVAHNFEL